MIEMPAHERDGYIVVTKAVPTGDGRFYATFSIHHGVALPIVSDASIVYQQGRVGFILCDTFEDAHKRAGERANAWIAKNPLA